MAYTAPPPDPAPRRRPQPDACTAAGAGHGGGELDDVLQLAQVARPAVAAQQLLDFGRELRLRRRGAQHALHQPWQVLALAQRRQREVGAVQAVVQVVAEAALAHPLLQRHGWRRSRAHRPSPARVAPMGSTSRSASTRSRRACRRQRHVADFVEEQRAAVGLLDEPALARGPAPLKLPGRWPNSSLSIRPSGMAAQFTATKGLRAALPGLMQGLGEVLLAAAGFAGDEQAHGAVDQPRGALDLAVQP
jgi:hypothetical protein